MKRYRFTSDEEDYRPIDFNVFADNKLPWWCTGYTSNDDAVIIAYLPDDVKLKDVWPEAKNITSETVDTVTYSSRFPKPWWCEQNPQPPKFD